MAQVLIFALGLSYFWLAVIAAIAMVSVLRMMRVRRFALAYATVPTSPAPPPSPTQRFSASGIRQTQENPVVQRKAALPPARETPTEHDSELVVLEITPDSEPLHLSGEAQSILKHRRASRRGTKPLGSDSTQPIAS